MNEVILAHTAVESRMGTSGDARATLNVAKKITAGFDACSRLSLVLARRYCDLARHQGTLAMAQFTAGSTDPELLKRIAAPRDNPAWDAFFEFYDPFVRDRCSAYGLDAAWRDELCQHMLGRGWHGGCRAISTTPAARFAAG